MFSLLSMDSSLNQVFSWTKEACVFAGTLSVLVYENIWQPDKMIPSEIVHVLWARKFSKFSQPAKLQMTDDKSPDTMKQTTLSRHFMSEITTRCQQAQICTTFHLLTFNRSDFWELVRKPHKGT